MKAKQIRVLLKKGMAPKQIAAEVGTNVNYVYVVRSELKKAARIAREKQKAKDEPVRNTAKPMGLVELTVTAQPGQWIPLSVGEPWYRRVWNALRGKP